MTSHDSTSGSSNDTGNKPENDNNIVPIRPDDEETKENEDEERGRCYAIELGQSGLEAIDIQRPFKEGRNAWEHIGIPYGHLIDYRFVPGRLILVTIRNMEITILGENLDKLYFALLRKKLKWVRQATGDDIDEFKSGEPRPTEIIIEGI